MMLTRLFPHTQSSLRDPRAIHETARNAPALEVKDDTDPGCPDAFYNNSLFAVLDSLDDSAEDLIQSTALDTEKFSRSVNRPPLQSSTIRDKVRRDAHGEHDDYVQGGKNDHAKGLFLHSSNPRGQVRGDSDEEHLGHVQRVRNGHEDRGRAKCFGFRERKDLLVKVHKEIVKEGVPRRPALVGGNEVTRGGKKKYTAFAEQSLGCNDRILRTVPSELGSDDVAGLLSLIEAAAL